jgi:hypothetical protein
MGYEKTLSRNHPPPLKLWRTGEKLNIRHGFYFVEHTDFADINIVDEIGLFNIQVEGL